MPPTSKTSSKNPAPETGTATEALNEALETANSGPELEMAFEDGATPGKGKTVVPGKDLPPAEVIEKTGRKRVETNDPELEMWESGDGEATGVITREHLRAMQKGPDPFVDESKIIKLDLKSKLPPVFYDSEKPDMKKMEAIAKGVLGADLYKQVKLNADGCGVPIHRYVQQSMYQALASGAFHVGDATCERNKAVDENPKEDRTVFLLTLLNSDNFMRLLDKCREKKCSNLGGFRTAVSRCLANGDFAR